MAFPWSPIAKDDAGVAAVYVAIAAAALNRKGEVIQPAALSTSKIRIGTSGQK